MLHVTERRNQVLETIKKNPTDITIFRTEKVRAGGGFTELKSTVGPFTVRIYLKKSGSQQVESALQGTKQKNLNWGMIADYNADIKCETTVTDEFDAYGGHFKITTVNPQIIKGQITGYQCELEKVL